MTNVALLGTGLIGSFYTESMHGNRGRDRVHIAYSRTHERLAEFANKYGIPHVDTTEFPRTAAAVWNQV